MGEDAEQMIKAEGSRHGRVTREDFGRLYPKVVAVLKKQGVPHEEARDLAQQALLAAHKGLGNFRHHSTFDTWVTSIAKKLLLRYRRDQNRQKRAAEIVPFDESMATENFEEKLVARDLLDRAHRAIQSLPEAQGRALILLARGFKYREIAQILNCSENRVSSLIHQARTKLRRDLRGRPASSATRDHV